LKVRTKQRGLGGGADGCFESLLGLKYDDLVASPNFAGISIPPPNKIGDRSYVNFYSRGVSLVLWNNQTVGAVQLHAAGHEGFGGCVGDLPRDLSFEMTRSEVRQILGSPRRQGEEGSVPFLGKKPAWDSFDLGKTRLHIEYAFGANAIQMLTSTPI
jgi:hypothetical protein